MDFSPCMIKSFKHDGHLHRMWLKNWVVPDSCLHSIHREERMKVVINDQTTVQESDGHQWCSKLPAVSFFIPDQWFNVVALLENEGIRYYCNIASPMYYYHPMITYIDYDYDVILMPNGELKVVDEEEYLEHQNRYNYSELVKCKVKSGLASVLERIEQKQSPFQDDLVLSYYRQWKSE